MYAMRAITSAIKTPIKRTLGLGLDALGVSDRRLAALTSNGPVWFIATFHRVSEKAADGTFDGQMCVPKALFREQLAYLKAHYEVMQVGEVMQRASAGQSLPPKIASITFDDGYLDNMVIAKPVLDELRVPWSTYVVTGGLETSEDFWWDRALRAFRNWPGNTIDLRKLKLSVFGDVVKRGPRTAEVVAGQLVARLWSLKHGDVERVLQYIEAYSPHASDGVRRRVNAEEVAKLSSDGVEIGVHTVRHPNLALLTAEEVEREVRDSRLRLEAICGAPVHGFAYPGGRFNDETVRVVSSQGMSYALSTVSDINRLPFDSFRLRRISMPTLSMPDFKRALASVLTRAAAARRG